VSHVQQRASVGRCPGAGSITQAQAGPARRAHDCPSPASPLRSPHRARRVQAEQERKLASEARKERRQTGEVEVLRGRLRELEAAQREKEEEMRGLRRSLRQREISLLAGGAAAPPPPPPPQGAGGGAGALP
jgi:hypothetical protein